MAYLIEKLIGEGAKRRDDKRMTALVRPLPTRARDLFDLIAAQGQHISFESITRGVELRKAEPVGLVFAMLGRWPSSDELAAIPTPYNPRQHFRQLLLCHEFRRNFLRRLLDAFPERQRVIHVRMPRCANAYIASLAPSAHPVLPLDLGQPEEMDVASLLTTLGTALNRFPVSNTVFMSADRAAPFLFPAESGPHPAGTFDWSFHAPPYRLMDRLFAVIRDPVQMQLSHANGIATALQVSGDTRNSRMADLRTRFSPLPAQSDRAAWKQLTARVLNEIPLQNSICNALGDGTAAGTLVNCRISDITLVGLSRLTDWVHTALGCEPAEPVNPSLPFLRRQDLTAGQNAALQEKIAEDQIFYDRFAAVFKPDEVASIRGSML